MRFAHPFAHSRSLLPLTALLWSVVTALLCAESHAAGGVQLLAENDRVVFDGESALDGDTALVTSGEEVYVFTRAGDGWVESASLVPDDPFERSFFGAALALDGDTAVVGASFGRAPDIRAGAVYVFVHRDGVWEQQAKLLPSTSGQDDYFGFSVDIDGDTVLVGAFGNNANDRFDSGAAFVFTRTGESWEEQARLTPDDQRAFDQFGAAVELDGDTALIAGRTLDDSVVRAFVREAGVWRETQTLRPAESGSLYANFGRSIALDGDTALIGANGSGLQDFAGAGYVFVRRDGVWRNAAKLAASDSVPRDGFGEQVALDGDTALITAPLRRLREGFDGAVYAFGRDGTGWNLLGELAPSDLGDGVDVQSVGVDGDTALVGYSAGAYAFDLNADIIAPGDADCGTPAVVAGTDRGLFVWQDCSDGGIRVLGAGGGESASYRGTIASSGSLTAPSIGWMEDGDSATLAASGRRIDFSLTLGGIWYDDFGYFAAEGSCLEVVARSENTDVYVGSNRRKVSGAFDPATGASCTLPETGDTDCGAPTLGTDAAGLYVWQDCDGTWKVLLTGYGASGGSVGATGVVESRTAIVDVQALSLEQDDGATLEGADRVAFELTTQSPWNDTFSFDTVDGGRDVCFRLESLSETLNIKVGRDRRTIEGTSYDAATGGSC